MKALSEEYHPVFRKECHVLARNPIIIRLYTRTKARMIPRPCIRYRSCVQPLWLCLVAVTAAPEKGAILAVRKGPAEWLCDDQLRAQRDGA
jgi:hypothetical protein